MPERQIASVVWHQVGHHIEVIYVEGDLDHLFGPEEKAAELAANAGLGVPLPTPDGMVRWVHDPDTWWST
jgi:hypothetical protein